MKTSLKVILCLAIIATSIYFWYPANTPLCVSDLLLQNIEALAKDENPPATSCAGTGSVDCPVNGSKVKYVFEKRSIW